MDNDERDGHSRADALRGHDSIEAEAIRAEGLDPDDPAVRTALDLVRWEVETTVSPTGVAPIRVRPRFGSCLFWRRHTALSDPWWQSGFCRTCAVACVDRFKPRANLQAFRHPIFIEPGQHRVVQRERVVCFGSRW